jgi:hypothetical protein
MLSVPAAQHAAKLHEALAVDGEDRCTFRVTVGQLLD